MDSRKRNWVCIPHTSILPFSLASAVTSLSRKDSIPAIASNLANAPARSPMTSQFLDCPLFSSRHAKNFVRTRRLKAAKSRLLNPFADFGRPGRCRLDEQPRKENRASLRQTNSQPEQAVQDVSERHRRTQRQLGHHSLNQSRHHRKRSDKESYQSQTLSLPAVPAGDKHGSMKILPGLAVILLLVGCQPKESAPSSAEQKHAQSFLDAALTEKQIGRYQIHDQKLILKIDTVTGNTWRMDHGKWIEVADQETFSFEDATKETSTKGKP